MNISLSGKRIALIGGAGNDEAIRLDESRFLDTFPRDTHELVLIKEMNGNQFGHTRFYQM